MVCAAGSIIAILQIPLFVFTVIGTGKIIFMFSLSTEFRLDTYKEMTGSTRPGCRCGFLRRIAIALFIWSLV